jgi:hypothetical protein
MHKWYFRYNVEHIKKTLVGLSLSGLSILLMLFAVSVVAQYTLLDKIFIASTFEKSGIYEKLPKLILENSATNPTQTEQNKQILNELSPVIEKSIPPELLQKNVEQFIGASFVWLDGGTENIQQNINTKEFEKTLRKNINSFLNEKIDGLPVCSSAKEIQSFNPFTSGCKPPDALLQANQKEYVDDFIDQLPLLGEDSKASAVNVSSAEAAQSAYTVAKTVHFYIGALIVLLVASLLVLSKKKYIMLRRVGHSFVWAGGLLTILSVLAVILIKNFDYTFVFGTNNQQVNYWSELLVPLSAIIGLRVSNILIIIGIFYALFGAILYTIAHKLTLNKNRAELVKVINEAPSIQKQDNNT